LRRDIRSALRLSIRPRARGALPRPPRLPGRWPVDGCGGCSVADVFSNNVDVDNYRELHARVARFTPRVAVAESGHHHRRRSS